MIFKKNNMLSKVGEKNKKIFKKGVDITYKILYTNKRR